MIRVEGPWLAGLLLARTGRARVVSRGGVQAGRLARIGLVRPWLAGLLGQRTLCGDEVPMGGVQAGRLARIGLEGP